MIRSSIYFLIGAYSYLLIGQSSKCQTVLLKQQVDSLQFLGADAFDCNSVFWRIVAQKKEAIPYLIEKISDPVATAFKDKCKKDYLKVGDFAYLALEEIIRVPLMAVTRVQFDVIEDGCWVGVFNYIENNREKFKQQVKAWYSENNKRFRWKKFKNQDLPDCYQQNHILGQYTY